MREEKIFCFTILHESIAEEKKYPCEFGFEKDKIFCFTIFPSTF